MNKVIYPGTFDPITNGHIALIKRAIPFFRLIIAVDGASKKNLLFSLEERLHLISVSLQGLPVTILPFQGFLIDFARKHKVKMILRGLRGEMDFDHEIQLANINRLLAPEIETVFLSANANNTFISSSAIKEIASLKGEVGSFVPEVVAQRLKRYFDDSNSISHP